MKNRLSLQEWAIVSLFSLVLLALSAFALLRPSWGSHTSLPPAPTSHHIQVTINGAVANPGPHTLPLRATMKQLLAIAEPLPVADLSDLNFRRKLRDGQTIYVPERYPIVIGLTGAIRDSGERQILSGTRLSELVDQLELLPEADIKSLKKKKGYVRRGDTVHIPSKGEKKKNLKSKSKSKIKRVLKEN